MTSEDRDSTPLRDGAESRSSASGEGRSSRTKKAPLPLWQETILLAVVALVLAVVVKTFLVQAFYIPSESMEPGLVKDDRILVQKPSYWAGEPQRGDVVVFKDPGGWLGGATRPPGLLQGVMTRIGLYPEGGHLVKRVIGVEGDVIECCDDDGNLMVNGVSLDESDYVKDDPATTCNGPMPGTCDWKAGPVPDGHLFVMGDNRGRSADSSQHLCRPDETDCVEGNEFVGVDLVVGRLFTVIWPFDRMRLDRRPDVFETLEDE
ncbi:signal peptidase I [Nocardioides sp. Y6]|uniref:Signal peptidase I n=1 Tax=Nocardioides malaquae TaxID=2773426 RepID=A0ABR9RP60_9ACTN|nr:signal peptidase I [Nocardioides malaquae]MBE7323361.1 signal peptidase I [Nocardioides malaquae]